MCFMCETETLFLEEQGFFVCFFKCETDFFFHRRIKKNLKMQGHFSFMREKYFTRSKKEMFATKRKKFRAREFFF